MGYELSNDFKVLLFREAPAALLNFSEWGAKRNKSSSSPDPGQKSPFSPVKIYDYLSQSLSTAISDFPRREQRPQREAGNTLNLRFTSLAYRAVRGFHGLFVRRKTSPIGIN